VPRDTSETANTESSTSPSLDGQRGSIAAVGRLQKPFMAWKRLGLPAKLLMLTAIFVMLAEILIFVPSVANFRVNWLHDRLTAAKLAALAADSVPGGVVPAALRAELLRTAEVKAVAWRRDGRRRMMLPPKSPMAIDAVFDLRPQSREIQEEAAFRLGLIWEASATLVRQDNRMLRVVGPLSDNDKDFIEVILPERPLQEAMLRYGLNILVLSIIISLFTAALVYLALSALLVRPLMRITSNMLHFGENPEDASRIITPSDRRDEVGTAERELSAMQRQLSQLLLQKNRLAQLGLAVSKINHDLRNMLANAQLISDRLGTLPDPTVQRFAPKLIASLDRAINFCNDTLKFGRAEEAAPRRELMLLKPLLSEIGDSLSLPREGQIEWHLDVAETLRIDADREHLYRVLANICRNALQVLETQGPGKPATRDTDAGSETTGRIEVRAIREGRRVIIRLSDNGPGVPQKAREKLFRAFAGSQRKGGTGLGLAIAQELVAAHGGQITLLDSETGAAFEIVVPDRSTD